MCVHSSNTLLRLFFSSTIEGDHHYQREQKMFSKKYLLKPLIAMAAKTYKFPLVQPASQLEQHDFDEVKCFNHGWNVGF